jgi:enamine deaminase RidA (YjgF/YER057c/UK114 family)
MLRFFSCLLVVCALAAICSAQGNTSSYYYGPASPTNCVTYINWANQPQPTGSWSFEAIVHPSCTKHEPTAGVRGWLPVGGSPSATQTTLNGTRDGLKERVRQAFRNLKSIVAQYNATLQDVTSVTCLTYDIVIVRPIVNEVQAEPEFWGAQSSWASPVYPPRTILGSIQFNGLDCLSANGTVYNGGRGSSGQAQCDNATDVPVGDVLEIDFSFAYPTRAALRYPYATSMAAVSAAMGGGSGGQTLLLMMLFAAALAFLAAM